MRYPSLLDRPEADEIGVATIGGVQIRWRRYGDGSQTIQECPPEWWELSAAPDAG